MSDAEAELRRQLTAAYRLSARFGWTDMVFNHISARLPENEPGGGDHAYLVNPEGLLSSEMTPAALLKVDCDGAILDRPEASFIPAGFVIHSAIHRARPDAACIAHNHAMAGMAVSCDPRGLLPLTQRSMEFHGQVAYHDFGGIELESDGGDRIVRDLGDRRAMIMRNHGLLTCGRSVAECWYEMYYLHRCCEIQMRTLAACPEPSIPPAEVCDHTAAQYPQFHDNDVAMVWAAMLRTLDREQPGWDR